MTTMDATVQEWLKNADEQNKRELTDMLENGTETDVKDAFYRDLAFGTGGLRGIIGVGSNRMNTHTVGKATQGLADYLNANFSEPGVAIARDSRNKGELFVQTAASVLAANGIKTYLYPRIEPTPALSFATRAQGCQAGICVTASHNPAPYNGYKVYGPDGCQITTQAAKAIQDAINAVDIFHDVKMVDFDAAVADGTIQWTEDAVLDAFIDAVADQSLEPEARLNDLSLVYTPLNGTGLECVTKILDRFGCGNLTVVPEQAEPDGNFPTCPYPNPEIREALQVGLDLCEKTQADLLLATDPDADRVGVAVRHKGAYELLSGNEMGILLLDYVCGRRKAAGEDLGRAVAVSTIVSTSMIDALAESYGFELRRTLTGFKYIGEQIGQLEAAGEVEHFVFGFEESYGYLSGAHVRDKDAVNASMLICQMAQHYKAQGMDLVEAMDALYKRYGYHRNGLISIEYPGADGAARMAAIMEELRTNAPQEIGGLEVVRAADYANELPTPTINGAAGDQAQTLPAADVLEFNLTGGNKVLVRPSGTEPKIKAYIFANGTNDQEAEALTTKLTEATKGLLQ